MNTNLSYLPQWKYKMFIYLEKFVYLICSFKKGSIASVESTTCIYVNGKHKMDTEDSFSRLCADLRSACVFLFNAGYY